MLKYSSNTSKTLLWAIIITLLLNSNKILHLYLHGELGLSAFSDTDEAYYLHDSTLSAANLPSSAIYHEHSSNTIKLSEQLQSRPNFIVPLLLGKLASALKLDSIMLGFGLDLILPFLSFIILIYIFKGLSFKNSEVGATCCLVCPWLFSLDQYVVTNIQVFNNFYSAKIPSIDSVPVLRGLATQVSYPFFLLSLLFAVKSILNISNRRYLFIATSGFLSGICWYIYFFSWGASLAIVCLLLALVRFLLNKQSSISGNLKSSVIDCGLFIFTNIATSSYGIYLLFSSGFTNHFVIFDSRKHTYFNLELLIIALSMLYLAYRSNSNAKKIILSLGSCCLLSQQVLMNLSLLLNSFMAEYHFPQLYLQPIFTAVISIAVFDYLVLAIKDINFYKLIRLITTTSIIVSVPLYHYTLYRHASNGASFLNLAKKAQNEIPKGQVFALPTRSDSKDGNFDLSFLPNFFYAISNQKILSQLWTFGLVSDIEASERELLLGFLYHGLLKFTWACPVNSSAGDLGYQISTWPFCQSILNRLCENITKYKNEDKDLACKLLNKYKVDYLISFENFQFYDKKSVMHPFMQKVWESTDRLILYKFNQKRAISSFCPK